MFEGKKGIVAQASLIVVYILTSRQARSHTRFLARSQQGWPDHTARELTTAKSIS